jgi:uncharacterized protein (DUF1501 family)
MNHQQSRRNFLKHAGALSGTSAMLPLMGSLMAMGEASAQSVSCGTTPSDYKALVCVFLAGGNDAYNTVMYNDAAKANSGRYVAARPNINRDLFKTKLPGSDGYMALNATLGGLSSIYGQGRMAIVANMGPLIKPTTATDYANKANFINLPEKLFSHNDQTSIWQTGKLEGAKGSGGWGARLLLESGETSNYRSIGVDYAPAFTGYWLPGATQGVVTFGASSSEGALQPASPSGFGATQANIQRVIKIDAASALTSGRTHLLEKDYLKQTTNALNSWEDLIHTGQKLAPLSAAADAIFSAAKKVTYTQSNGEPKTEDNPLAAQLAMVYRFVASRNAIGAKRQVFFVQLDAFDTHSAQVDTHERLLTTLNAALVMFDQLLALDADGTGKNSSRDRVTTFTASEFGRKLNENGDGSDHGWGGHHLVMGGAQVKGYAAASTTTPITPERSGIFGKFPQLSTYNAGSYGDPQLLPDGTLIPTISVDQVGWQLGAWLGLCSSTLNNIFPNCQNFSATGINVNFLNTTV